MLSLFFEKKKEKIIKKLLYTYTLVVMVHYSNVFFLFFFCFFFLFCNSLKVNVHFSIISHCNQDNLKLFFFFFFFQNSILLHAERKIKMSKYTNHKLRPEKSKHHHKKHNVTEASILSAVRWTKVVLLLIC